MHVEPVQPRFTTEATPHGFRAVVPATELLSRNGNAPGGFLTLWLAGWTATFLQQFPARPTLGWIADPR